MTDAFGDDVPVRGPVVVYTHELPPRKPAAQTKQLRLYGVDVDRYVYAEDIQTTNEERRELGVRRSA